MKSKPHTLRVILLWTVILVSLADVRAATVGGRNNFIINYSKLQSARSGAQTWDIASYNTDWMYFANQNGLLQYNGNTWTLFPLHNGMNVRSVWPSHTYRRIYAGGISEFGYFEPDAHGVLRYICMSDSLSDARRYIGNVWGIHEMDNVLFLQGDTRFLKYVHGHYTDIDVGCKIDCSGVADGVLYAGTSEGVKVLMGNQFIPLNGSGRLNDKRIRGILPADGGITVVTATDGLFFCDGHRCEAVSTPIDDFLMRNDVFCATLSGDLLALGTIRSGVAVMNIRTGDIRYFNEANGLQNNTVLSLAFDAEQNLWAGTDNGIDCICLSLPWSNLYPSRDSYGAAYCALPDGNRLYLGTSRGLYVMDYGGTLSDHRLPIRMIPHSSGQVWGLSRINDRLFCFHDRGVFLIEGEQLKRIGTLSGAWTGQAVMGRDDCFYIGVYDGICLLTEQSERAEIRRIEGINDSFRFFAQESERVLWLTDLSRCYRVQLDSTLTRVLSRTEFGVDDGLPAGKVRLHKTGDAICFSTPEGFYRYDAPSGRIVPDETLNRRLGKESLYYHLTQQNDRLFGLTSYGVCVADALSDSLQVILFNRQMTELVPDAETFVVLSDSLLLVPHYNGFMTTSTVRSSVEKHFSVRIGDVLTTEPRDSLLYTFNYRATTPYPQISYLNNSLRFEFGSYSFSGDEEVFFQCRLNQGEWSTPGVSATKEYSNLPEGRYTFEVRARFADGEVAGDSFDFRILPPWYRSTIAYLCYIMLMLGTVVAVYKWDNRRVKRKKQQVVQEKDREMAERERVQTANLLINLTRKNEILTNIKGELHKVMSLVKDGNEKEVRQQLLVLSSKIDTNTHSEEVLQRIEEQFDLMHNNFMTRLQAKHPTLTFNERMMCAYLKMNLSSKEIAPLMNLSVRGVETIRYRIRKKLGLGREVNLLNYLEELS
ncbi:MAG: transcriptional regulator [Mediterranea sp.]|jgi:DNA-binding CsgD family transcriptional regulator|nr:transcriptional regulator [Mediterranea sp.]